MHAGYRPVTGKHLAVGRARWMPLPMQAPWRPPGAGSAERLRVQARWTSPGAGRWSASRRRAGWIAERSGLPEGPLSSG